MDFEKDIVELRKALSTVEQEHSVARAAADKVVADLRESGVNPMLDKDAFAKVDEAYKGADSKRDEASELRSRLERVLEMAGQKASESRGSIEREEARREVNAIVRFLESDQYKRLAASPALKMDGAHVEMPPVEAMTRTELRDGLRQRTTVDNSSGSGGGVIWSDRREDLIVPFITRRVRLLDVITVGDTDSDTVEWVEETTHTDAAAETAFGTAAPESAYGWTKRSTTVKRLPHFVPATKGALADSGQLRTLLEGNLMKGVRLRAESQVYNGDGTGENLKGIMQTAGIGTQARGADTRFDAVHKAITNVRVNYQEDPTVIGLSPADFESIVLEKDSAGNYVHGRAAEEPKTIWGLTPVVSTLFTTGTPLVGDFSQAILWLREGISLAASDSHQDFFVKGLVAILAQMRAAFAVPQPKAFCKLTGF